MKTHLLRVKPPWRLIDDQTRCGRLLTPKMTVMSGTAEMAATARKYWQWREMMNYGKRHVPEQIRETYPGTPEGLCGICWWNIAAYGHQEWKADPLEVLRVDLAVRNGARVKDLRRELVALADLVIAHHEEFASLMLAEDVLTALGGSRTWPR